ncbi:MAG: glutaredoxin family protein [Candidatus Competibacteraceae bacterium]|nr:glutaredoxin family protein [Candidatus Competibacteraceae bacterium]HRY14240.1 glutaredoxin family protein [Candidatus Competibacteraceae bacterium]
MNRFLILYTTSGCHLCEQAENLIQRQTNIAFSAVEIADDAELLERYGARIPVLQRLDTGEELDWPFAVEDVEGLLMAALRS